MLIFWPLMNNPFPRFPWLYLYHWLINISIYSDFLYLNLEYRFYVSDSFLAECLCHMVLAGVTVNGWYWEFGGPWWYLEAMCYLHCDTTNGNLYSQSIFFHRNSQISSSCFPAPQFLSPMNYTTPLASWMFSLPPSFLIYPIPLLS